MDIGALIARCRSRAGLSQRDLAARSGTSAAAICLHESGSRMPRVDTLDRIVGAAGGRLHLLVTWPEPIDVSANGRTLEQVLDLADDLPRRSARHLTYPLLRDLGPGPAPRGDPTG